MKYFWRILGLALLPIIPILTALTQIVGAMYMVKRAIERDEGAEGLWAIVGQQWYTYDQSANAHFRGDPNKTISHRVAISERRNPGRDRFKSALYHVLAKIDPKGHANFRAIEYDD